MKRLLLVLLVGCASGANRPGAPDGGSFDGSTDGSTSDGATDADVGDASREDGGAELDAGDPTADAGVDASFDAGVDSGIDAGIDAGVDSGIDSGVCMIATCAPGAGNECCLASCAGAACATSAGACSDVCGGTELRVARSCLGCGAANAAGACMGGATHLCDAASLCRTVTCGGTSYTCTNAGGSFAWRTATTCDDGNACTSSDACNAGTCAGTVTVTCPADTTCRTHVCTASATCVPTPRNVGGVCDDGNASTPVDRCAADGTCVGRTCPTTLTTVFGDDFSTPSSTSWTSGTDTSVNGSRWRATTSGQHGVRISSGVLSITNERSGSAAHGQGYALVSVASDYDSTHYRATLKENAGQEIVWTFNMRRDATESGGFSCSSSSSQNGSMIGMAYVLAASSGDFNASSSSCSAGSSAYGYAVTQSGGRVRLVRFQNGLRNGALTTLVESSSLSNTGYLSVRVTYDATTDLWRLEARSASSFSDPTSGSYTFTGTATDATWVNVPLDRSGAYFQTGCCCLCEDVFEARFDNVRVATRCSP
jgi:hypothetical protein